MKKSIVSPQSQELIELLGIETALRLFRKLGGINIEMGKKLEVCDYALLKEVIGAEKAAVFHKEFSGMKIYIPQNSRLFKKQRIARLVNIVKRYQKQGLSFYHGIKLACCELKICENTALKWAKEANFP